MKNLLFLSLAFLLFSCSKQKYYASLNHIAHYVVDLNVSTQFYHKIVGLDTIPEPFRDGKHTWFAIGDRTALHLISGAQMKQNRDKNSHLCFTVPSVTEFMKRLQGNGIPYENWTGQQSQVTNRVDGVKQIYFKDPDGYWVEINDAKR